MNTILGIPSEEIFRAVKIFMEPATVGVSGGGKQHISMSQAVSTSLTQLERVVLYLIQLQWPMKLNMSMKAPLYVP